MLDIIEHISGGLSDENSVNGTLRNARLTINGSLNYPPTESIFIHYNTKTSWDIQRYLLAERGHLYIYRDAAVVYDPRGRRIEYPGIKIGDGDSSLYDLPFAVVANDHDKLINHIQDFTIHVRPS